MPVAPLIVYRAANAPFASVLNVALSFMRSPIHALMVVVKRCFGDNQPPQTDGTYPLLVNIHQPNLI